VKWNAKTCTAVSTNVILWNVNYNKGIFVPVKNFGRNKKEGLQTTCTSEDTYSVYVWLLHIDYLQHFIRLTIGYTTTLTPRFIVIE
jgi:hypothetical protein